MNWGFVDYENLGSLKEVDFKSYERLFIFCGPKNPTIKLGDVNTDSFINLEIIKLKTNGAKNLDFHIAYYLGKFTETAPEDVEFHILSKDNGFNGLVSHIKANGRTCRKVIVNGTCQKTKITLSPCARLTVKRLSAIDGRSRPRVEAKLINWIESQCRSVSNTINSKSVLGELVKAGLIKQENGTLKYTLKR